MSNKVAVACPSFDILSPNDFYGVIRTVVIARNACLQQMRCHPPVGGLLLNDSSEIGSLAWVVDRQALMQECPEPKHTRKKRKINENEVFFLRMWPMLAGFILHGMRRKGCHNGFIVKLMLRLTEGAPTHTSSGSLSRQQFIQAGVRRVFGEQLRRFMLKFVRGGLRRMQMTQPICILMSTLQVILAICSCLLHCCFEIIVECFIMLAHAGNNFAHF
jgi:hypothetical protein